MSSTPTCLRTICFLCASHGGHDVSNKFITSLRLLMEILIKISSCNHLDYYIQWYLYIIAL